MRKERRTSARELNARLAKSPRDLPDLVRASLPCFNPVHCATALHRVANKSANLDQDLLQALAQKTQILLDLPENKVNARTLTSIAWAVAKLHIRQQKLREAIAARSAALLNAKQFDAYGVSIVAWAIATLFSADAAEADDTVASPHPELLSQLATSACSTPEAFRPQEATNLLWAFATLRVRHARLFEVMGESVTHRIGEFTPQGLSTTVWACAKLGLAKHALFLAAAASALPRLSSFDTQSIATIAWAFANIEIEHGPLIRALCTQAETRMHEFDGTSCAQLLWALVRLKDGVANNAVVNLSQRLRALALAGLDLNQLLYALGALARLSNDVSARDLALNGVDGTLSTILANEASKVAVRMTANKLGIAAWGLSRPAVRASLSPTAATQWIDALCARCKQVEQHLGWRSVGHIEMALQLHFKFSRKADNTPLPKRMASMA